MLQCSGVHACYGVLDDDHTSVATKQEQTHSCGYMYAHNLAQWELHTGTRCLCYDVVLSMCMLASLACTKPDIAACIATSLSLHESTRLGARKAVKSEYAENPSGFDAFCCRATVDCEQASSASTVGISGVGDASELSEAWAPDLAPGLLFPASADIYVGQNEYRCTHKSQTFAFICCLQT